VNLRKDGGSAEEGEARAINVLYFHLLHFCAQVVLVGLASFGFKRIVFKQELFKFM
jgi:hypothetical protein